MIHRTAWNLEQDEIIRASVTDFEKTEACHEFHVFKIALGLQEISIHVYTTNQMQEVLARIRGAIEDWESNHK